MWLLTTDRAELKYFARPPRRYAILSHVWDEREDTFQDLIAIHARCAAEGISVYSPHTALDSVRGGINDWLAQGLGEGEVSFVGAEDPEGRGGAGRVLTLREGVPLAALLERVVGELADEWMEARKNGLGVP